MRIVAYLARAAMAFSKNPLILALGTVLRARRDVLAGDPTSEMGVSELNTRMSAYGTTRTFSALWN